MWRLPVVTCLSVVLMFFAAIGSTAFLAHENDGRGPNPLTDGSSPGTVDSIPGPSATNWSREGVVLDLGPPGSYDSAGARSSYIMKDGATYRMWYSGSDGSRWRMLYATSTDAVSWTRQGVAINVQIPPYNFDAVIHQSVMKDGSTYKMWFAGGFWAGGPAGIWQQPYYAESPDGVTWTIVGPALGLGPPGAWDDSAIAAPNVVLDASGQYLLYYAGWDGGANGFYHRIGLATSTDGRTFARTGPDPVLALGAPGSWDGGFLTTPYVISGAPWQMWYAGSDGPGIRIGRATSLDGLNWTKAADNPEFREGSPGAWDDAGVHAGQVFSDSGSVFLYYTGSDSARYRIGRAHQTSGFAATGMFESSVLDTGRPGTVWNTLSATAATPPGTQVMLSTRSGDVPTPDVSWSTWSLDVPPGTSPVTSPRARYLQVRATLATTDIYASPLLQEFAVDYDLNQAATPTPLSPGGGDWVNSSSLRVSWAYSDPESDSQAGFRVQISNRSDFSTIDTDSSDVLSTDAFWRSPPLADGGWFWRVRTLDTFGTWSPYSAPASVRIDTMPPMTFLNFAVTPGFVYGVPQLDSSNRILLSAFDVGSGGTTTLYSVDFGPPTTYTGPFLPSSHGPIDLAYWSVDVAGNAETPNSIILLLDNAPTVALAAPPSGIWTNSSRLTLDWTYADPESDPASTYEVQLASDPSFATIAYSSGQVSGTATSHTFPGVADGTYLWRVRAADSFGVWSVFSTASTVSVDTGLPAVAYAFSATLGTVDGRTWIAAGTTLTLTATDTGSGVADMYYSIDGGAAVLYDQPVPLSSHGTHTVLCWAVDAAGNAGPKAQVDFLIDRAPSATNVNPGPGWPSSPPIVTWNAADSDGDSIQAFEVQIANDSAFSSIRIHSGTVTSPDRQWWQAPLLPDGTYYWRVRVEDLFGVWSAWSSPTVIQYDTTPPETNALHDGMTIPAGVFALSAGDAIELNATDAASGVARIEYSLDGAAWTDYSGPIRFDAAGRHVLAFRAVDNARNVESTRILAVDATYPFNWTPVITLVLAVVLALVGAVVISRRKDPEAKPSKGLAWAIMAGPGTVLEAVVGVYSLVTGELAMPPWLGAGLVTVLAVAVVGFVSIALGAKALAAPIPAPEGDESTEKPAD